jgi:MOSC domain-containing protein
MGGERIDATAIGERGLHADRMWAIRDLALGAISTARRLPPLLTCTARYPGDPADVAAGPGRAPEVLIRLPGGEEISSSDPQVHARLSDVVGREVRLEPLPPVSEKERYRAPRETKATMRAHFGLADDEPIPDLSAFPLRMLAELSRYVTPLGSYVDAYPVHLLTLASIATMTAHAPSVDFDVRRFRPNLVVDTGEEGGLPENSWCGAELETPGTILCGEIPTIRCVMPTREQISLRADPDVLRTVAAQADRCLGLYASVKRPGMVAVGDQIQVRHLEPPSRAVALAQVGATTLKRGVLRAASALMPRE